MISDMIELNKNESLATGSCEDSLELAAGIPRARILKMSKAKTTAHFGLIYSPKSTSTAQQSFGVVKVTKAKTTSTTRRIYDEMPLTHVQHDSRLFTFRHPLTNTIQASQGVWTVRNSYLGIIAYGQTIEETVTAFYACFVSYWDGIACEDPVNLTEDAKSLRNKLKKLVKTISKVK